MDALGLQAENTRLRETLLAVQRSLQELGDVMHANGRDLGQSCHALCFSGPSRDDARALSVSQQRLALFLVRSSS